MKSTDSLRRKPEKRVSGAEIHLPDATVLERLAISDKGFVFDPVTGNSLTVNATGLALLRLFQRERDLDEIVAQITSEFDVSAADAERDALDFAALIRNTLRP